MKISYFYISILIFSIYACKQGSPTVIKLSDLDANLTDVEIRYSENGHSKPLKAGRITDNATEVTSMGDGLVQYIIPSSFPCYAIRNGEVQIMDKKKIVLNIYVDESIKDSIVNDDGSVMDIGAINKILTAMNFGYEVEDTTINTVNFTNVQTKGTANVDILVDSLMSVDAYNPEFTYQVYLFNESEFFNTANAITINYKPSIEENEKSRFLIMGDGQLLKTPMLLAHELGHAFGLGHNNMITKSDGANECDNMFNVMHESNIGCVRGLCLRQVLLMHEGKFVDSLENDTYYPQDLDDVCECDLGEGLELTFSAERYVNSFDRNIDDTPLVGDHNGLLSYKNEALNNVVSINISDPIKANFEREYHTYINSGPGGLDEDKYLNQRWVSHKKLRRNNIIRWLGENMREFGLEDSLSTFSFVNDSLSLYFNRYEEKIKEKRKEIVQNACNELRRDSSIVTVEQIWECLGIELERDPEVIADTIQVIKELELDFIAQEISKLDDKEMAVLNRKIRKKKDERRRAQRN